MMRSPSRRDFLKLTGLAPLSLAVPRFVKRLAPSGSAQNVIVMVFDALSAYNMSLYGYGRETTPNLTRLAKRAVVYHNHFAAGNFTTPGTASLLTGTLPWTHRAIGPGGRVAEPFVGRSLFRVFRDYYRLACTHNGWAYTLLQQLQNEMDELLAKERLFLTAGTSFIDTMFGHDDDIATVSWAREMRLDDDGFAYSLFGSRVNQAVLESKIPPSLERLYPLGLPGNAAGTGFLLEQAIDWVGNRVTRVPKPFFGYFHMLPPHAPYHTSAEFHNLFKRDGRIPIHKPVDVFAGGDTRVFLQPKREYDEFILYADREFGRLYDLLDATGLLESTWVVFTSDHGEMFERGLLGHGNPTLYQPVIRVPLLIFEPGRATGLDIHSLTSAVDVLPTLARVTGHPMPDWTEGVVLPPYHTASAEQERSVYAVQARENAQFAPLTRASTMLVKGRYKLQHYFGYPELDGKPLLKLYDIEADPEELVELSSLKREVAADLLAELKSKLAQSNQPYL